MIHTLKVGRRNLLLFSRIYFLHHVIPPILPARTHLGLKKLEITYLIVLKFNILYIMVDKTIFVTNKPSMF